MLYDTRTNFKEEIKKLKSMSFKDKLWYIKEYYLIHIIIILFILSIGFSMLFNILKKEPIFNAYLVNVLITEEEKENIVKDFSKYSNLEYTGDIWNFDNSIQIILDGGKNPMLNQQYLLKLTAIISSKGLDVMITQKEIVDYFLKMEAFLPLDEVLSKEFIDNNKNNLYKVKDTNNIEKIYAINIVDSPLFKSLGIEQDVYFVIAKNSKNVDMALKFLDYIYKEPTN